MIIKSRLLVLLIALGVLGGCGPKPSKLIYYSPYGEPKVIPNKAKLIVNIESAHVKQWFSRKVKYKEKYFEMWHVHLQEV